VAAVKAGAKPVIEAVVLELNATVPFMIQPLPTICDAGLQAAELPQEVIPSRDSVPPAGGSVNT